MESIEVIDGMEEKMVKNVRDLVVAGKSLIVDNPESYELAGRFLKQIKAKFKEIETYWKPVVENAHKAHKEAVSQMNRMQEPLFEIERALKKNMTRYAVEQEQERQAIQLRAENAAKKKQEDERLRIAEELEKMGKKAEAEAVIAVPIVAPVLNVPSTTPMVSGQSYRTVWKFTIVNVDLIPRNFLLPDEKKIGGYVRSMKGMTAIPGVEVYSQQVLSSVAGWD